LAWVRGENEDTDGATSNGSGKSTLFKALTWCLYGDTIDRNRGDDIVRFGQNSSSVRILTDCGWVISRKRANGSTKVELSNEKINVVSNKKYVQLKINDIVGLDFKAFKNTVLFGQNDGAKFANPNTRDVDRKEILHKILKTDILKACHKITLMKVSKIKKEINELIVKLEYLNKNDKKLCDELAIIITSKEKWSDLIDRKISVNEDAIRIKTNELKDSKTVEILREKREDLLKKIKSIKLLLDDSKALIIKVDELRSKLHEKWNERIKIEVEIKNIQTKLDNLNEDVCHVCLRPMTGEIINNHEEELIDNWELKSIDFKLLSKDIDILNKQTSVYTKKIKYLSTFQDKLYKLNCKLDDVNEAEDRLSYVVKQIEHLREEIEDLKKKINPHLEYEKRALDSISELKSEIEKIEEKLIRKKEELYPLEFWSGGFSGRGISSYIFDTVMDFMTERTNYYLNILSDGDISVEFSTQRELKSSKGEYRDEINISWTIEGVLNRAPSGGQLRKIEIATDLALMELAESHEGNNVDLFIADEILDGLDSEGINRVVLLLEELRKKRGTIFVISHQPNLGEIFENSITVVKKKGVSKIYDCEKKGV
jgi:DNA repair exonuclease SbcCD ATPase subunit